MSSFGHGRRPASGAVVCVQVGAAAQHGPGERRPAVGGGPLPQPGAWLAGDVSVLLCYGREKAARSGGDAVRGTGSGGDGPLKLALNLNDTCHAVGWDALGYILFLRCWGRPKLVASHALCWFAVTTCAQAVRDLVERWLQQGGGGGGGGGDGAGGSGSSGSGIGSGGSGSRETGGLPPHLVDLS